jgi:hypothetical protein
MNESDTMTATASVSSNNQQQSTINAINYHQGQTMLQPQQQASNAIHSSTSPLSNSSTNSSSCMTTSTSFSSPSLYSPLNQGQFQQLNNQIVLSIPIQNNLQYQQQQQQQQQSTNLVTVTTNNANNTSSTPTGANNSANNNYTNNNTQNNNIYLDAAAFTNSYSLAPQNAALASSTTTRPEAKKVKTNKTQPSKVAHIRNIPPQLTEVEVIQFGLIFGNIINVLNLRSKCQVLEKFKLI